MGPENTSSVRAALRRSALRAALIPRRPVFRNPWDSEVDMFACYAVVSVIDPVLLWCGGELMGSIFGFGSRWPLGVFLAEALVGAAGFVTIAGRSARVSRSTCWLSRRGLCSVWWSRLSWAWPCQAGQRSSATGSCCWSFCCTCFASVAGRLRFCVV
jgi:hypothetical protein